MVRKPNMALCRDLVSASYPCHDDANTKVCGKRNRCPWQPSKQLHKLAIADSSANVDAGNDVPTEDLARSINRPDDREPRRGAVSELVGCGDGRLLVAVGGTGSGLRDECGKRR